MKRTFAIISVMTGCITLNLAASGDNFYTGIRELPLPPVPDTLTVTSQRAAYVMAHFWDAMDWTDSLAVADRTFMEQNLANFYSLVPHTDSLSIAEAVGKMVKDASVSAEAVHTIFDCSAQYLDEPESPVYNVDCYDIVTHKLLDSPALNHTDSLILAYRASQLELHRVGSPATDFVFTDRTGNSNTLHKVVKDTPLTLLVFYNPGCHDCELFEYRLIHDEHVSQLVKDKKLTLLFINPYGTSAFKGNIVLPDSWVVGVSPDGMIDEEELYHIPQLPTIFLLDSDARILRRYISPSETLSF
ncbi:MAG: DUF5106 domain-containing protein [Paramuribaculum sp.]|nr:DUF5106 domain-containing protein [Paramuribaculum sp.]